MPANSINRKTERRYLTMGKEMMFSDLMHPARGRVLHRQTENTVTAFLSRPILTGIMNIVFPRLVPESIHIK